MIKMLRQKMEGHCKGAVLKTPKASFQAPAVASLWRGQPEKIQTPIFDRPGTDLV